MGVGAEGRERAGGCSVSKMCLVGGRLVELKQKRGLGGPNYSQESWERKPVIRYIQRAQTHQNGSLGGET